MPEEEEKKPRFPEPPGNPLGFIQGNNKKSPLPEPRNPLEFMQDLSSAIEDADRVLHGVDERLRSFDDQLNSFDDRLNPTPGEPTAKRTREEESKRTARGEESYEACYRCSFEHLGEVLNAIDHASGREPGSEEFESKVEMAMDKLLEVEREHLGPKDPERSAQVRKIRKKVESHLGPGEPEASLAEIEEEVREIRPEMRRLWKEHAEKEGGGMKEELEKFFETEDEKHLDRAKELAGDCDACRILIEETRKHLREGEWSEAERKARELMGTEEAIRETKKEKERAQ